jgi:hypothetical protein
MDPESERSSPTMLKPCAGLAAALLSAAVLLAQGQPPAASPPKITLTLYERHGHAMPQRHGFEHTGGGNTDVSQPAPDTVVVAMTGVAVAGPHPMKPSVAAMDFDFTQCFEITADKAELKTAKLTLEARVIGLLRTDRKGRGSAEESGCAAVAFGPAEVVRRCAPAHAVAAGEDLSINDHDGPVTVVVGLGKYTLHQTFHIAVHNARGLCGKASSAEFAPDPALDPLWISYWEPFHGAAKKDFGFQVTVKVTPE